MTEERELKHSFAPVARPDARFLILGSLPGEESLRQAQYYAHKRNAFWRIMGELWNFDPALPYSERLEALMIHRIALWDVAGSGFRPGSLDSNLKLERPNDIPALLARCPGIRRIGCNGGRSYELFRRCFPELVRNPALEVVRLPSTSPAAALYSFETKREAFRRFFAGGDAAR